MDPLLSKYTHGRIDRCRLLVSGDCTSIVSGLRTPTVYRKKCESGAVRQGQKEIQEWDFFFLVVLTHQPLGRSHVLHPYRLTLLSGSFPQVTAPVWETLKGRRTSFNPIYLIYLALPSCLPALPSKFHPLSLWDSQFFQTLSKPGL